MKQKCIEAVRAAAKAAGIERVTDADLRRVEEQLAAATRKLASTNRHWHMLSAEERMLLAIDDAQADIRADAARKASNLRAQLLAQSDLAAIEKEMVQLRPNAPRPAPITGKLSWEREDKALKEARQEFYRASAAAYEARVINRDLVGDIFVDLATLAARAIRRGLAPERVKQLQEDAQYASLAMRAADQRRYLASLQDEPRAGMPVAAKAEPVALPQKMADLPGAQEVARLAAQMPDLEVTLPGTEERFRLRDVLARIEAERTADDSWAEVFRAAGECALAS